MKIWKEIKVNEWQEVSNYEHLGSANAISWAPSECGLKLLSCSSDGNICILYEKGQKTSYFSHKILADNEWDKLIAIQAHNAGVNCISFAPVNPGCNYFVLQF